MISYLFFLSTYDFLFFKPKSKNFSFNLDCSTDYSLILYAKIKKLFIKILLQKIIINISKLTFRHLKIKILFMLYSLINFFYEVIMNN